VTITACRKYENTITLRETWNIWIDTNSLPDFSASDKALVNRLHPIPFPVQFTDDGPHKKDRKLKEKLMEEAEGILASLVEYASRYCAEGLSKPPLISQAAEEWRASVDQVGNFLKDCTEDDPGNEISELYKTYKEWCRDDKPMGPTRFNKDMESKGYRRKKRGKGHVREKHGYIWLGLKAKQGESSTPDSTPAPK